MLAFQNKTKQNKTKQNKTKQNKTKQNIIFRMAETPYNVKDLNAIGWWMLQSYQVQQ